MKFLSFLLLILCSLSVIHGCGTTAEAPVFSPKVQRSTPAVQSRSAPVAAHPGYYEVTSGDTLYSIAWRYSFDYRDLAAWNNISSPYTIYPGQRIYLYDKTPHSMDQSSPAQKRSIANRDTGNRQALKTTGKSASEPSAIHWHWPTQGKLISSDSPTLQKGVNISGRKGQAIFAAAGGDVVYSGSGLLGYGKLIIIKHNDVYLSAYAHNQKILVKEGMKVSSGQKIATMGTDSDHRPLLHFEIRKEGQPVDPLKHLPKQQS